MDDFRERVDAFKVGFLRGLADQGITPSEFCTAMAKEAKLTDMGNPAEVLGGLASGMGAPISVLGGMAMGVGKDVAGTAGKALLAAPIVAGGLAGVAAERLSSPDPKMVENLQKAELIGLYKRLATKMKERKARGEIGERVI